MVSNAPAYLNKPKYPHTFIGHYMPTNSGYSLIPRDRKLESN